MAAAERGAEDFYKLSKALKAAGRTDLRKYLHMRMLAPANAVIPKVKAAARSQLPAEGGLNALVAGRRIRARVRTGEATAGVSIVSPRQGSSSASTNRGYVRHPVPKDHDVWVRQELPRAAGWFDDTIEADAPAIRRGVERGISDTLDHIARQVEGGI